MRILSKDFPTSLFHSTAPGWVQSSIHQPLNQTISIAYHLKNFLLWLIFINIINNYTLNFKLYFGEVDVVSLLSNYKPIDNSLLSQNLENILRGIYVRNEATYLTHINDTTIIAKPIFICNDNSILTILIEGFFNGDKEQNKLKLGHKTIVQNIITERFPHSFTVFHLNSHIKVVQEILVIFLTRLYTERGLDIVNIVKKVKYVIAPVTIGKFGILVNSFVLYSLYVVFHCVPKSLIWHYSNLALLYVSNTVNIAFILMILISKSQLRDFSNNISYCLLIIEFISFLAIMLLFFNDHKTIISRQVLLPYSCPSSVYSERNSKIGDPKTEELIQPEISQPPSTHIHNSQQSPKQIINSSPLEKQQQLKTILPQKRDSVPIQSLQEQYATPVPLTTPVIGDPLHQGSITTPGVRNPERRCVTVPVNLPRKYENLHHSPAGHPGHLPNLQL